MSLSHSIAYRMETAICRPNAHICGLAHQRKINVFIKILPIAQIYLANNKKNSVCQKCLVFSGLFTGTWQQGITLYEHHDVRMGNGGDYMDRGLATMK